MEKFQRMSVMGVSQQPIEEKNEAGVRKTVPAEESCMQDLGKRLGLENCCDTVE